MRSKLFSTLTLAALAAFVAGAAVAAATPYELDFNHSGIGFSVKHFGISNVRGKFAEYSGALMIDEDDLSKSSVAIEIAAASIDTANEQRDGHLRSADFFDVENHPTLTFKSTGIERTGEGEFLVTGDLTIRGKTREVRLPVTVGGPIDARGAKRIGIEGALTIDRQDYGVSFSRVMDTGGLVVGNDVKIDFSIEATHTTEVSSGG